MTVIQAIIFFLTGMIALIKNQTIDAYVFFGLSFACGVISDILTTIRIKKGDSNK